MRKILYLASLVAVAAITIIACQREVNEPPVTDPNVFNEATAKEWYYSTFKKSAEWGSYNSAQKGAKLPDWSKGVHTKIGDREIVEYPLLSARKVFKVPVNTEISFEDNKRVAQAAVSKVLFMKSKTGSVSVREMQIIPDIDYLRKHQFDASKNMLGKIDADFSGTIIAKTWSGKEVAQHLLKDGKIVASLRKALNRPPYLLDACQVGQIQVTEWAMDCETHLYGDGLFTKECGEWFQTGNYWCFDAQEVTETPECINPNSPACYCQLVGGCEDPPPSEDPNGCTMSLEDAQQMLASMSAVGSADGEIIWGTESEPDTYGVIKRPVLIKRHRTKFNWGGNYSSTYALLFTGVAYKTTSNAQWKWESLKFDKVSQLDGTTPPCLSVSVSAAVAGPVISSDKKTASFSATLTASASMTCVGGVSLGTVSEDKSGVYNAGDNY